MNRNCRICGAPLAPGEKNCPVCHNPIDSEEVAQPVEQEPTQPTEFNEEVPGFQPEGQPDNTFNPEPAPVNNQYNKAGYIVVGIFWAVVVVSLILGRYVHWNTSSSFTTDFEKTTEEVEDWVTDKEPDMVYADSTAVTEEPAVEVAEGITGAWESYQNGKHVVVVYDAYGTYTIGVEDSYGDVNTRSGSYEYDGSTITTTSNGKTNIDYVRNLTANTLTVGSGSSSTTFSRISTDDANSFLYDY